MKSNRLLLVVLAVFGLVTMAAQSAGATEAEQLTDRVFGDSVVAELEVLAADGAQDSISSAVDKSFELYNGVGQTGDVSLLIRTLENGHDEATVVAAAREKICIVNYRTGLGSISACQDLETASRHGLTLTTKRPRVPEAVVVAVAPLSATSIGGGDSETVALVNGVAIARVPHEQVAQLQFFDGADSLGSLAVDAPADPADWEE